MVNALGANRWTEFASTQQTPANGSRPARTPVRDSPCVGRSPRGTTLRSNGDKSACVESYYDPALRRRLKCKVTYPSPGPTARELLRVESCKRKSVTSLQILIKHACKSSHSKRNSFTKATAISNQRPSLELVHCSSVEPAIPARRHQQQRADTGPTAQARNRCRLTCAGGQRVHGLAQAEWK